MKKILITLLLLITITSCVACTENSNNKIIDKNSKDWCIEKIQTLYKPSVKTITAEHLFSDFDKNTTIKGYWVTVDKQVHFTILIQYKSENLNIAEEKVKSTDIVGFYIYDGHKQITDLLEVQNG